MARAGRFRERAVFEAKSAAGGRDRFGNPAPEWGVFLATWGDLREATGKEMLAAGQLEATARATLRVRGGEKAGQVTGAHRVKIRGHVWSIIGAPIAVDRAGRVLEFRLERGGAGQ